MGERLVCTQKVASSSLVPVHILKVEVIVENDNTCKNCKHWALETKAWCKQKGYDFTPWDKNTCSKLNGVLDVEVSVHGDAYVHVTSFDTPKDFGCSLFEKDGELA